MARKKKEHRWGEWVVDVEIQNKQSIPCNCEKQRCHGSFIPSRVGQTECIWSLAEKEQLDSFPVTYGKKKRKTSNTRRVLKRFK